MENTTILFHYMLIKSQLPYQINANVIPKWNIKSPAPKSESILLPQLLVIDEYSRE